MLTKVVRRFAALNIMDLGSNHFLSLPRPDVASGPLHGIVDTTTLAAHDFDVDPRTGFMPPQAPISRLPPAWESWECTLEDAIAYHLKLGDSPGLSEFEQAKSELWRSQVRNVCFKKKLSYHRFIVI
jgi:indoleamine 2,3-dioxygenase